MLSRLAVLLAVLCTTGCTAHQLAMRSSAWNEVRTAHVLLRTDVDRDHAIAMATMMQETRDAFAENVLVGCFERAGSRPIEVTVLEQEALFRHLAGPNVVGLEVELEGWDDELRRILLSSRLDVPTRRVFQHELTHRLVHACLPRGVPTWLNEGLASYYETAVMGDGELLLGIPAFVFSSSPYVSENGAIAQRVSFGSFVGASAIRMLDAADFYGRSVAEVERRGDVVAGHYGTAWALVHMLKLGEDGAVPRWNAYLGELFVAGVDGAESAWNHVYGDLDVESALPVYVARDHYEYVSVPYAATSRPAATTRAMTAGEAHLELAAFITASTDRAREERRLHLHAAMEDPATRSRARLMLAEDAYRSGEHEAAVVEMRAAFVETPHDPWVMRAWLDMLVDQTPVAWLARDSDVAALAEKLGERAVTAAQLASAANALLACGYRERSLTLARSSVALDPETVRGQLVLARAYATAGRVSDARRAIDAALASVPHDDANAMRRVLALRAEITARGADRTVTHRPLRQ